MRHKYAYTKKVVVVPRPEAYCVEYEVLLQVPAIKPTGTYLLLRPVISGQKAEASADGYPFSRVA